MSILEIKQSATQSVQTINEELICLEVLLFELLNQKNRFSGIPYEQEDYILRLEELEEGIKMLRCLLFDFDDSLWSVDRITPRHVPGSNQRLDADRMPALGSLQDLEYDDD